MDIVDPADTDTDCTMDGDQKNREVGSGCNSSGSNMLYRGSEDETEVPLLLEVWDGSPEAAGPSSSSPGESTVSDVDGLHGSEKQPSDVIGTCQTVDASSSTLSDLQHDKDGASKVKGSYTEGSEKSSKQVSQSFSTKGGGYKDSSCKSGALEIIDLTKEEDKPSASDNGTQRLVCGTRDKNDRQESNKSKEHVAQKPSMKTRKLEDTSLNKSGALEVIDLTEEKELQEEDIPSVSGAQRDMHKTRDKNHDSSTSSEVFRSSVEQCDLEQARPCMIDLTGYDATRDLDEEVAVILDKSLDPSIQNPTSSSCSTGYTVTISTSQPRRTNQDSSFHAIPEDPDTRSAADAVTSSGSFDDASSRDTDAFVRTLLCREPGFVSSSSSRCSSPEWEDLTALNEGGTVSLETTPSSTDPCSNPAHVEELDLRQKFLNNYPTCVNPSASPYTVPDKVKANNTQSEDNNMERNAFPGSPWGESTSKERDEKKTGLQALLSLRIGDIISPISVSDSEDTESTDNQNIPDKCYDNSPTVPCSVSEEDTNKANSTQGEDKNQEKMATPGTEPLEESMDSTEGNGKTSGMGTLMSLETANKNAKETDSTDMLNTVVQTTVPDKCSDNSPTLPCSDPEEDKVNRTQVREEDNQEKMASPRSGPSEELIHTKSRIQALLSLRMESTGVLDSKQDTKSTEQQDCSVTIVPKGSENEGCKHQSLEQEVALVLANICDMINSTLVEEGSSVRLENTSHKHEETQSELEVQNHKVETVEQQLLKQEVALVRVDGIPQEQEETQSGLEVQNHKDETVEQQPFEQEVALVRLDGIPQKQDKTQSDLKVQNCKDEKVKQQPFEQGLALVKLDGIPQKHEETESELEVQNHKDETVEQQPLKQEVALTRVDSTPQKYEETQSGLEVQNNKDEIVEQQPLKQEVALVRPDGIPQKQEETESDLKIQNHKDGTVEQQPFGQGLASSKVSGTPQKQEETQTKLEVQHHKDKTVEQQENIVGRHNLLSHVATGIDNGTGVDIMELYEDGTVAFEAHSPGKDNSTIVNITLSPVQPRSPNKPPCCSQSAALGKTSSDVFEVDSTEDDRVDKQCVPTTCSKITLSKDRDNQVQSKDTEEVEKMDQGQDERIELQEQAVTHVSSTIAGHKEEIESQKPSELLQDDEKKADKGNKEESYNGSCSQSLGIELQSENPIDSCKEPGEKDSQDVRCTSDSSPTVQKIKDNTKEPSKISSCNSSEERTEAESTGTVSVQSPPELNKKKQDAVPLKENVETPTIQKIIEDPSEIASSNSSEEQMEAETTGTVSGEGQSPPEQHQKKQEAVLLKENVENSVEEKQVDDSDSSLTIQIITEDSSKIASSEERMEAERTGTVSVQSPPEQHQKKQDAVPLKENEEEQDNSESSPTIQTIIEDSSKTASNNSSVESMAAESTETVSGQGQSPPEQNQKKQDTVPLKESVENAVEEKQVDGSNSSPTIQMITQDPEDFAKTASHNTFEEQMGAETTGTVSGQSQPHPEQEQKKQDTVPSKESIETAVVEEDLQIDNSGSSTLNSPLCKDIDFSQLDDLSPNSSIGDAILDFVQQAQVNIQGVLGEEDKSTERDPSHCVKENQVPQLPVEFESCGTRINANCGEKQKLQLSTSSNCGLNELMDEISQLCETRDCTLFQETEEQGSKEQHMHTGVRHCPVVSQTFDTEEKEESSEKSGTQGLDGFVRRADNINQNTCVESSGEGQRSLDGRRGDVHGATINRKENSSVTMATSRGSTMGQVSLWDLMDHQGPFIIYPSQGGGGEGVRIQSTQPAPASTTTDSPTVTQGMSRVGNAVYSALSAVNADCTGGQQDKDEPTTMLDLDTHTVTTTGGMVLRSRHATNADQCVVPRATANENPCAQQTEIENTTQISNTSGDSKDTEGETNEECRSELDLQVGVMTRARARRLQQLLFLEEAASDTALTPTVSAPVTTYDTDSQQAMQPEETNDVGPAVPPEGMDAVAMAMMCSGLEDDALEDVTSRIEVARQVTPTVGQGSSMTREDLVEGSAAGQIIHCIPGANVTQTINRAHPDLLPTVITSMSSLAGHHVTSLTIQEQEFLFLEEISYKVYNHTVQYVLSRCNLLQISRIRCKGQYLEFLRPYCRFIDRRSNHCYLIRTEDAELLHRSFLRLKKKEKTQKTGKKKKGSVLPRCAQCGHEEQLRRRGRKRQAEATVSVNPEEHQAERLQEDAAAADVLQSDLGPDNLFPRGRMPQSSSWNPTLIGFCTDAACQTQDCSTEKSGQCLEKECEEPPRKRHCSSVVATACQTTEESEQLETAEKCPLMEQHSRVLGASEESSSLPAEGLRSSLRRRHESRSSVVTSTQSINLLAESSANPDEQEMTTFYITTKVVGTRLQKVNISVCNDKGEELAGTERSRDSEGEQVSSEDQGYSETIEETPVSPVEGLGSGQELEYSREVGKMEEVTHSGILEFGEQTEGCTTSSDSGVSTKTMDSIEKCNSSLEQDVSQSALCMEQADQGVAEGCTASDDSGVSTKTMDSIEKHRSSPASDVMISPLVPSMKKAEAEAMIEGCAADCGCATKTMASNSSLESDASPSPVPCMHQDEEESYRAGEKLDSDVCKKRPEYDVTGDVDKDDMEDVLSIMQESVITVTDKRKEVLYNTKEEAKQDMCLKLVMEDSDDVEEAEEGLGEVMSIMYESGIDLAASSETTFTNREDALQENFLCANESVMEQNTSGMDMEDVTSIMEDSGISMAEDVMSESCTYHKADTRGTTDEAESKGDVATLDQNKNKVVPSEKNLAKIDKTIEGYLEKEQNVEEEKMKTAACQDDTWKCPNQNHETVAVEDQSAEILYTHQNGPKRIGHLVFDTEAMPSLSPIQAIVDRKLSYSDTKASCHEPSSSKGSETLDQAVEESNQTMECSPRSLKPTLHSQRDKDAKLHSESSGPSSITPVRIPTSSSPQPCIPSENVMSKRSKSGLLPNCSVCLWDCSPLLVSHTSKGGAFTGWGYLYPHWCSSLRDDPCVYCPVCNAFYNVSAYLGHFHEKQGLVVHRGSYGLQMESRQVTGAQKRQWNDFAKRHPAAIKGCATPQKRLLTATQRNVGKCRRKIAVRFTKVKGGKWTVSSSSKGCTEKDVSEDKASGTEQQHDNFAENTAALAAEQQTASCRTNQSASENTAAIVQEQQTASYRRSKYTAESTAAVAEEQQTASCSTNKNAAEDNTADVEEQETASCSTSKHSATEDTAAVAEGLQTASCSRRESVAADTQAASVDANHANGLPGPISSSEESGPSEGSSSFSSAVPKGKPRGKRSGGHPGGGQNAKIAKTSSDNGKNSPVLDGKPRGKRTGGRPGGNKTLPIREVKQKTKSSGNNQGTTVNDLWKFCPI